MSIIIGGIQGLPQKWSENPSSIVNTGTSHKADRYPRQVNESDGEITLTTDHPESSTNVTISVQSITDAHETIDDDEEISLCAYKEETIFPKWAVDRAGQQHYIINNEDFPQETRVTICVSPNSPCNIDTKEVLGRETYCKQKYVYQKLFFITPDGTDHGMFRIPSSCACYVKSPKFGLSR